MFDSGDSAAGDVDVSHGTTDAYVLVASAMVPVFSWAEPAQRQCRSHAARRTTCTLEIGALDHADPRPAAEGRSVPRQAGYSFPKVLRQVGHGQARLVQHRVQPSEADGRLEGVLAGVVLALNGRQQRGDDLSEPVGGRRGGGRGALGAVGRDLRLGARCESEACMRR
jgi:hypothetical protein